MSDTQPLLTTNNTLPEHDNENRQSISPFFDWRRWFSKKQTEDNYRNIDDEGEHTENESHVGFFQLFRFADRIDLLLLFIGICSSILHAFCLAARLVLFGRVAGAFASDVSPDGCHLQQQKLSITDSRNNGCPWGIELNSFNYARLNKLCNISDSLISSTPLNPHMITFRAKIINKVEWLLIIGTVEFICSVVEYYVFTVSARRQTTRIRVRLFQSLIQRSTSYFDTNPTGQLNAKLFDHIDNISRGIGFELAAVIGTTFAAIGGVIIALSVNWKLTLILLCLIPLTVGGVRLLAKFVAKESMNELNSYSRAGQIAQEVFSSLRTVLSLNGGMFERKRTTFIEIVVLVSIVVDISNKELRRTVLHES
ncbi:hypothetical protein I4U23_000063 [Adineta vaga]|nr:hypothetical protein I4U23_000063 [Adineta vaga]